jgi:asparagine synthase (glutamine-hydrolysing)
MCGILGWAGPDRGSFNRSEFEAALGVIAHRGPDDWGVEEFARAALGHRRLSIIDLSASGHQPMYSKSRRECIVFNGEIYNYLELRARLEVNGQRLTGGDTESLIEIIERDGVSSLSKLNGMWAFASWNDQSQRLLLSRDRFGVKPLYYVVDAQGIVFASEPKAILKLRPALRKVDPDVLADFLVDNKLHGGERSFYQGLKCLTPGSWLTYDARSGAVETGSYWRYPDAAEPGRDDELCEEFASLLEDAVSIRLRSDVAVGLTLSGGLDSSAILAASSKLGVSLQAFTSVYQEQGVDELKWARLVSDRFGNTLLPAVARYDDWQAGLQKIAWHMDSPGYSPAVFPLWSLMQTIREKGVKVILEGQGADEALGGYPQYIAMLLAMQLKSLSLKDKCNALSTFGAARDSVGTSWALAWTLREAVPFAHKLHRQRTGLQGVLNDELRRRVMSRSDAQAPSFHTLSGRLEYDHGEQILPGLLHYGDAMSMAHGVEARNPFLDYRLVEFLFKCPDDVKIRAGLSKWVLRRYLDKNRLPEIAARKDKRGYPTPIASWLARLDVGGILEEMLATTHPLSAHFDAAGVRTLCRKLAHPSFGAEHHVYKLVSTYFWAKACL